MRHPLALGSLVLALLAGTACGGVRAPVRSATDIASAAEEVSQLLDGWHAAAARSDFDGYFALMAEDSIFLGTDATERWTKAQFQDYARGPFAEGRGWVFRSVRRDVVVDPEGRLAWFDEDLDTVGLGPARGSGVARRDEDGAWRLVHYDLALTVPNERFAEVKALLAGPARAPGESAGP